MKYMRWAILPLVLAAIGLGKSGPAGAHSGFSSAGYLGVDDVQSSGGNTSASASYGLL